MAHAKFIARNGARSPARLTLSHLHSWNSLQASSFKLRAQLQEASWRAARTCPQNAGRPLAVQSGRFRHFGRKKIVSWPAGGNGAEMGAQLERQRLGPAENSNSNSSWRAPIFRWPSGRQAAVNQATNRENSWTFVVFVGSVAVVALVALVALVAFVASLRPSSRWALDHKPRTSKRSASKSLQSGLICGRGRLAELKACFSANKPTLCSLWAPV